MADAEPSQPMYVCGCISSQRDVDDFCLLLDCLKISGREIDLQIEMDNNNYSEEVVTIGYRFGRYISVDFLKFALPGLLNRFTIRYTAIAR
jgi:hypothetical protein